MAATCEWATPVDIVEAAREVFGGTIDTDPCTSDAVNAATVHARRWYTVDSSGLEQNWSGCCLINPPGGKGGLVKEFWREAVNQYLGGVIHSVIWVGFSIHQLQVLQNAGAQDDLSPLSFPICVPRRRLSYLDTGTLEPMTAPTHPSFITYMGPGVHRFKSVFGKFGKVRR